MKATHISQDQIKDYIITIPRWEGMRQKDIQTELEKKCGHRPSQSVVSRATKQLLSEGLLTGTVKELKRRFACLQSVRLVRGGGDEELGQAAAAEFAKQFRARKMPISRLALGSGSAVGAFVDALPQEKRMLTVAPTSLALRRTDGASQDALWNVLRFHWKSDQKTSPCVCAIPPFVRSEAKAISHLKTVQSLQQVYDAAKRADFVVLGIGSVTGRSPILDVLTAYGVDEDRIKDRVTSEVNLCLLDENGLDITAEIFNAPSKPSLPSWEGSHPAFPALGFSALKEIADDPKRQLMAIAGGQHKVQPIRAALLAGLINVLVTDRETALGVLTGLD
jgi:DNA-binding transcriptional regulator LsrR (DeoR family)